MVPQCSDFYQLLPRPMPKKGTTVFCTQWPLPSKMAATVGPEELEIQLLTLNGPQLGLSTRFPPIFSKKIFIQKLWGHIQLQFCKWKKLLSLMQPGANWSFCYRHWWLKKQFLDFRPPWGVQKIKKSKKYLYGQITLLVVNLPANFCDISSNCYKMRADFLRVTQWAIIWRHMRKVMKWEWRWLTFLKARLGRLNMQTWSW